MQQKKSFTKSFLSKSVYLLYPFFIAVCFFLLVFLDTHFTLKRIELKGVRPNVLKGLYSWNDTNLILLKEAEVVETLTKINPMIKTITVVKKYPSSLLITVSLYKPSAYFSADSGYFIVSDNGRVLQKTKQKELSLPVIHYYQKLNYIRWQSGDFLTYKDILAALRFLQKTSDLGMTVDTVDIAGTNMIALQLQAQKILFTTEKDIDLQEYQLETLARQFKIKGGSFRVLDLRFDKPIIQF